MRLTEVAVPEWKVMEGEEKKWANKQKSPNAFFLSCFSPTLIPFSLRVNTKQDRLKLMGKAAISKLG